MDLHSWEEVGGVKCGDYKLPSEPDKWAGATQGTSAGTKPLYPTQSACSTPSGRGFGPDRHTTWGQTYTDVSDEDEDFPWKDKTVKEAGEENAESGPG